MLQWWTQLIILILYLLFESGVPFDDFHFNDREFFNRLSHGHDESVVIDEGENVTLPDIVFNPDSWEIGSSVVDAIIRDNANNIQSGKSAVYPGMIELPSPRVKVQCSGRGCDDRVAMVTADNGYYQTLPLFGRESVVISLSLSQMFEVHKIDMNIVSSSNAYHFKVRKKIGGTRKTMFEISNQRILCGVDYSEEIRRMCLEEAGFSYDPQGTSTLTFSSLESEGVSTSRDSNSLVSSWDQWLDEVADWRNAKILEIVLLPPSNEVELTVYRLSNLKLFGRCSCNGHADDCTLVGKRYHCDCRGNTCGSNCERCCPKFNAFPWQRANSTHSNPCTECLCYGKSSSCVYDRVIASQQRSYLTTTQRGGGGVCQSCSGDTTGFNCDTCKSLFYRPANLTAWAPFPCIPCDCHMDGVIRIESWPDGDCVKDNTFRNIQGRQMLPGQCFCKDGWTGRRCDQCSPGWYPSDTGQCEQCTCNTLGSVTSTCSDTGVCECRVGYTGNKCDRCSDDAFIFPKCAEQCFDNRAGVSCETCLSGFYMKDGRCVECECSSYSSCDAVTGSCDCQEGFSGVTCHTCSSDLLEYPKCENCSCSNEGTLAGCNDCQCKSAVRGIRCDTCKTGHFGLSHVHRQTGCLQCYCSHVTAQCSVAVAAQSTVSSLFDFSTDGWVLTDGTTSSSLPSCLQIRQFSLFTHSLSSFFTSSPVFFSAPAKFLGNKALSYGGFFNFSYAANFAQEHRQGDSLHVWLVGRNNAVKYLFRGVMTNHQLYTVRIPLLEEMWEAREGQLDRSMFMDILVDLRAVLIGASFVSPIVYTRLQSPSMTTRSLLSQVRAEVKELAPTVHVEKCACPLGHTGSSCEECSDGYYKVGKLCQRCHCNSLGRKCDSAGRCLDCRTGHSGDHCEICSPGYYQTEPLDCTPCPCPNNGSCMLDGEGEIRCNKCLHGVTGNLCNRCIKGYYGTPELGCKKCRCHGNLDLSFPTPCDQTTGRCLRCAVGTTGTFCEKCADDFWSPTPGLNCQRCECSPTGRRYTPCDPLTGQCPCKAAYTSRNCSECKPYTYGYLNDACKNCNCDVVGSHSLHCNGTTGNCYCRTGHTGRRCEKCDTGYWKSTGQLCTGCKCNEVGSTSSLCGPTGQCSCHTGYTGRDCSECDIGYIWDSSSQTCSECESCTGRILEAVSASSAVIAGISTVSQDYFITKTTNRLRSLKTKSNKIMVKMREKISLLMDYEQSVKKTRQVLFSSSKREVSLPRQADKLLLRSIKSSDALMEIADGLDSGTYLKNEYFRNAYFQYEYTRNTLPEKLADLQVTRPQLRALSREVKSLKDKSIEEQLAANTGFKDECSALAAKSRETLVQARDFKQQCRASSTNIDTLSTRVRHLSTTITEIQMEEVGASLLPDTRDKLEELRFVVDTFVGWKDDLLGKVTGIEEQIDGYVNWYYLQNVSQLLEDVKFLHSSVTQLPQSITIPLPLESDCGYTAKLVKSMYQLFRTPPRPQPIRDLDRVKEVISHIDTITSFQDLGVKYRDMNKVRRKIKSLKSRSPAKVTRLKNEVQVCNHRLKVLAGANTLDRERLNSVQRQITILSNKQNPRDNIIEEKTELIEEYMNNLTVKKRRFRTLERKLENSMERVQQKIDLIKSKVLTFESVRFGRNDWSRYSLPKGAKNITLSFKSEMKGGTLLSVGPKGSEEDLFISTSRGTISVTCYQPTTMPLFTLCTENSPMCYSKLGTLAYTEYFDPRATFDGSQFATLYVSIEYGEVTIKGYQNKELFLSQTVSCLVTPSSFLLTRAPSQADLLSYRGFAGCISQLEIGGTPRGIRHADHIVGQLTRCEHKNNVEKSIEEDTCPRGFFSLSTQTVIPSSSTLGFELVITRAEKRVVILTAGSFRVAVLKGQVRGSCHGISISFADFFQEGKLLQMSVDIFETFISLRLSDENNSRTRKLPCVVSTASDKFIIGVENPAIRGCIKEL